MVDKNYCMSSFLMYRRVMDLNASFSEAGPPNTTSTSWNRQPIKSSFELEEHIKNRMAQANRDGKAALALSGGIDSAILAKFMPKGSTAYTFKCVVPGVDVTDETERAHKYATECELNHKIIEITWEDMEKYSNVLMMHKKAPIHSIEVQIYRGGVQARHDGLKRIIYGETADVNYGGLSNILSRDWRLGDFIERYSYMKPWLAIKNPKLDFSYMTRYEEDGYVNVHKYLSEIDILESINSYVNACETANIEFVAPYADTFLDTELDYQRIRNGENKYLLREFFERLYPGYEIPDKIPMPRPMDIWMKKWNGPQRPEFIRHCEEGCSGDQKWLLWCLERYLNLIDNDN